MRFIRTNNDMLISVDSIRIVDFNGIEKLELRIRSNDTWYVLHDNLAIDAAMILKPSILEGKQLRFARNAWMVHNLVGHPLMQLCALFGFYEWAFKIHDSTIPRPIGIKTS